MSEFANDAEQGASAQFDINNPALMEEYAPEIENPEAEYNIVPRPTADGTNLVEVSLAEPSAEQDSVYLGVIKKGANAGQKFVIAVLEGRFVGEDGELAGFLERNWVNSLISKEAGTSELASLMFKLGLPFQSKMTFGQQIAHVKQVFAKPQRMWVRTEWRASWAKMDPNTGAFIFEGNRKVYDELKGQKKFETRALQAAHQYIAGGLQEGESTDSVIEAFLAKAHIISNPYTGEEIVARAGVKAYEQRAE